MTGQRNGQSYAKMADDSDDSADDSAAKKDSDGQGHNSFLVRHARVWPRASTVQLVPGGSAAIQCLNPEQ